MALPPPVTISLLSSPLLALTTTRQDLPFKKGDVLTVLNTSEDPNWWIAKNKGGKDGMIPANYVELLPDGVGKLERSATLPRDVKGQVEPMPWFHGKIARGIAEEVLKPYVNGSYLIRESTNYPGDYTLCVCHDNAVENYRIQTIEGKITIDEEEFFLDLGRLIEHYKKDADGLCSKLVKPKIKEGGKELANTRVALASWEIEGKSLEKKELLGAGQFGEVFEGTYKGEAVAIKTLKDATPASIEEFMSEAHVMADMKHENIVQFIGCATKTEPVMIVSEFMAKGCLLDYLRSRGRAVITGGEQLGFTKDIAAAMLYLEQKNFVHRDLAARNILLDASTVAKVADFGLAKDSRFGKVDIGKLPIKWTAPEALRQKISTSKSDVWSYGIVMWEIYSYGRAPYPRMSQKEVVDAVATGYRMEKPDSCPADLHTKIMAWCWEIDAKNRPSFKQLSDKLKKFTVAK
jgi:c-src tyrosine kinase